MTIRPITLTKRGAVVSASHDDFVRLSENFEAHHCVRLPGFLESGLLHELRRRVERAEFHDRVHEGISANLEQCMRDDSVTAILFFIFNDRELFRSAHRISGCPPIGCFQGRVYRCIPGAGHHDAWHDDLDGRRLLALSVNLGNDFTGGVLEIRDRISRQVLHRAANTVAGDAVLFRLAPELEHRITEVRGTKPKTAFAGWFMTGPEFRIPKEQCAG